MSQENEQGGMQPALRDGHNRARYSWRIFAMKTPVILRAAMLASALCAAAASPLHAQQAKPAETQPSTESRAMPSNDRIFLEKAAQAVHAGLEAGKLASGKASSEEVRRYAQQLVEEHGRMGKELAAIAAAKGVTLPALGKSQEGLKELEARSGAEFDRMYMTEAAVKTGELEKRLFQQAQKDTLDPELKAFVDKTLPRITQQLEMARQVASVMAQRK
jgi:putative membrane protein